MMTTGHDDFCAQMFANKCFVYNIAASPAIAAVAASVAVAGVVAVADGVDEEDDHEDGVVDDCYRKHTAQCLVGPAQWPVLGSLWKPQHHGHHPSLLCQQHRHIF